jgi:hypothetical protein
MKSSLLYIFLSLSGVILLVSGEIAESSSVPSVRPTRAKEIDRASSISYPHREPFQAEMRSAPQTSVESEDSNDKSDEALIVERADKLRKDTKALVKLLRQHEGTQYGYSDQVSWDFDRQ